MEEIIERGYNVKETSVLLAVKERTVREWLRNGIINGKKIAGTSRWIITKSEILRLMGEKYNA